MPEPLQDRFAAALLDRRRPVPDGIRPEGGSTAERRFAVYRDTVSTGLIRALSTRFPVAQKIVGDAFFSGMAQEFIRQHPPRSPVLLDYGDAFAAFVERFGPAGGLAYLPDVIRLEAARSKAYHAADEPALEPAAFASLAPERLAELRLRLHPSAATVRSGHPVATIWAMNAGLIPLRPIEDWNAEEALIIRPQLEVRVHCMPAGTSLFVEALRSGSSMSASLEAARGGEPGFDLTAALACIFQSGLFTGFR